MDFNNAIIDFFSLGMGKIFPISAVHGQNINNFINKALLPNFIKIKLKKKIEKNENFIKKNNLNFKSPIKIAIVGRPNVGKSTLTNYFIKKDRMVVFHIAGTTRDSIYIPIKMNGKYYIIIDTAGIIKKFKVKEKIENFSVIKTIQAIDNANVVLLVINAIEGITNNDLSIIGMILKSGKSIVIAVNKWDKINLENVDKYKKNIYLRFRFINFAKIHFISALYGSGIKNLFNSINEAYKFATKEISTANITRIMHIAIEKHHPPLVRKNKIKLKYAHVGGYNPPLFIIHGTKLKYLPNYYKRYLINFFRDSLKIIGTPIRLFFKETRNPYILKKKK